MKKRLLVIDDDESFAFFCKTIFGAHGWDVLHSDSLDSAQKLLAGETLPMDFVFIDFLIPPDEGHQIARAIANNFPELVDASRISIVSNYGLDTEPAQRARNAGFLFQQKPGDIKNYLKLVDGK